MMIPLTFVSIFFGLKQPKFSGDGCSIGGHARGAPLQESCGHVSLRREQDHQVHYTTCDGGGGSKMRGNTRGYPTDV